MRIARFTSFVLSTMIALPFAVSACGGDDADNEAFDTLQDCFDDHHGTEGLPIDQAIVVCCVDHPIAGVHPSCGSTEAACQTHVDAELDPASATTDEIATACQEYIADM